MDSSSSPYRDDNNDNSYYSNNNYYPPKDSDNNNKKYVCKDGPFEAFIAACIVEKSVGTVISGLQNSTELVNNPSNGPSLQTYFLLLLSESFGG